MAALLRGLRAAEIGRFELGILGQSGGITVANNITLTNGSGGSNGPGQLDNQSGDNVVTGTVSLAGAIANLGSGLVTIGASAGTLRINGVIQNGSGLVPGAFAKVGPGTVILGGDSPNTFTNLTRVFGGYLMVEKDGAFGAGSVGGYPRPVCRIHH